LFRREKGLGLIYAGGSRVEHPSIVVQVEALRDGVTGDLVDPQGMALPPCIVMERGESLQEWANRAEPDLFAALAVCLFCPLNGREFIETVWPIFDCSFASAVAMQRWRKDVGHA
jgi:hypothetical protein